MKGCVLAIVGLAIATQVNAEVYVLAPGGSGESPHAFNSPAEWINESGETVMVSPSAGNDYVVDSGRVINCNETTTFAGKSLTIGHVGGSDGTFMHMLETTATIGNFICENGLYRTWRRTTVSTATVAGEMLVKSPRDNAFRIHATHDAGKMAYVLNWNATISGAVGTGLFVGPHPHALESTPTVIINGNNVNYLGTFELSGTNSVVEIGSASALGGPLGTFDPEALVLRNRVVLAPATASVTLAASDNRGICVKSNGACLRVDADRSFRIEWPFNGSGLVEKIGPGTLTLASSWDSVGSDRRESLVVSEGGVEFAEGFSNAAANPILVKDGTFVGASAGEEVAVSGIDFEGSAMFRVSYDAGTQQSGILVLSDGLDVSRTYQVVTCPDRKVKVPFLKVPTAKGVLTSGNFKIADDLARFGSGDLPQARILVEESDGYYVVSCETFDLVSQVETARDTYAYPYRYNVERWSDNKAPHDKADYEVVATNCWKGLASTGNPDEFVFAGGYLRLLGSEMDSAKKVDWLLSGHSMEADVRTGNRVCVEVTAKKSYDDNTFTLSGKLDARNTLTGGNGLVFKANPAEGKDVVNFRIASRITGSGEISFQPKNANQTFNVFLDNSMNSFDGPFFFYIPINLGGSKLTLAFGDAGCLGCNPRQDNAKMLLQSHAGAQIELHPTDDVQVALPNRKFVIYSGKVDVRVDDGKVFELSSPIEFNETSVTKKLGGGVWALAGTTTIPAGASPTLRVEEGYIRTDNARALVAIPVAIADGAGVAAKYRPGEADEAAQYGMIVTDAAKFTVEGETLAVKVDVADAVGENGTIKVPVLTVPSAVANQIDAKRIVVSHNVTDRNVSIVKDSVTVGDTTCVRYSAKFSRGLVLFVR